MARPAPSRIIVIPEGTAVELELTEPLSSRTSRVGDAFGVRLAAAIIVDQAVAVPRGATGGGEVVNVRRPAMGGRPGAVMVVGRFLELNGQRVPIRYLQVIGTGRDNSGAPAAVGMSIVGLPSRTLPGNEIDIAVGTRAIARLGAEVEVPPPSPEEARHPAQVD